METTEKRNQPRAHYREHIIYSLENKKSGFTPYFNAYFDAYHGAEMVNCSETGMSFTADKNMKKGSQLLVKATGRQSELRSAKSYQGICSAEVVWSKKCETCKTGSHTIGIHFND